MVSTMASLTGQDPCRRSRFAAETRGLGRRRAKIDWGLSDRVLRGAGSMRLSLGSTATKRGRPWHHQQATMRLCRRQTPRSQCAWMRRRCVPCRWRARRARRHGVGAVRALASCRARRARRQTTRSQCVWMRRRCAPCRWRARRARRHGVGAVQALASPRSRGRRHRMTSTSFRCTWRAWSHRVDACALAFLRWLGARKC